MDMIQILPSISQALATFAGAVFVLIGIWYRDRLETNAKARNAKVQIVAEVKALIDLIELNGYLPALQDIIADRKAGGNRSFNLPSSGRSFTAVYEANLSNLGLLDSTASDVVRFYMIINSVLEDKDTIMMMMKKRQDLLDQGKGLDATLDDNLTRFHEVLYGKLSTAIHIGEKIIEDLRLENPKASKIRQPHRAATIVELDDIQKPLDHALVSEDRAEPASAHQTIQ